MVAANDARRVFALLLLCGGCGMWAERRTSIGAAISGAMVTFLLAMAFSAAGVLPSSTTHPVFKMVWTHLVPLAIVQMMLSLDKKTITTSLQNAGGMLTAFAVASCGTVLGTLAACTLVRGVPEAWKLAASYASTYVGGTINMMATMDAVGLREPAIIAAVFSSDMVMMALYFSGLFFLARRLPPPPPPNTVKPRPEPAGNAAVNDAGAGAGGAAEGTAEGFAWSQAVGVALSWAGFWVATSITQFDAGIPCATALALLFAFVMPARWRGAWGAGPTFVAALLVQVFFAAIGAGTDVRALLSFGGLLPLLQFVGIIILVHGAVVWVVGRKLLGLDPRELLLASNAAIGGPTTAAAMAGAMGWTDLVSSSVMVGTVGYVVGTPVGLLVGAACKTLV